MSGADENVSDSSVLFNEIDEHEFDIPEVDQIPSLESILNSVDDDSAVVDSGDESRGMAVPTGHTHRQFSVLLFKHFFLVL
jgi:hypothetical protein